MYIRGRRDRAEELKALYARIAQMDAERMYSDVDAAVRESLYERIEELEG